MAIFRMNLCKDILALAIPISFFNLTTVFISIANGLMLAKLGDTSLAAGALIGATQIALMMICSSPLFAISSQVSRMNAESKFFQIGSLVRQGYVLSLGLSIPAVVVMLMIQPILTAFAQPTRVIHLVDLYFQAYWWGVPTAMLLTCSQQFMLGLKKTRLITMLGIASLIISILLGYILAFGKLGFSPLGIAGLGWAQTMRTVVTTFLLFGFLIVRKEFNIFQLVKKRTAGNLLGLEQLVKLGWPISVHAASEYLALFCITLIVGKLGQVELIAQQIAAQYTQFLSIPILALSQASNLLIGTSIGKRNWKNMLDYGYLSLFLGSSLCAIAVIGFYFFTQLLVSPYLSNQDYTDFSAILKPFLVITMIGQMFAASKAIGNGMLRALYDTKTPMFISVVCGWGVAVPFAYLTTSVLHLGMNGLAAAQTIAAGSCALLLLYRWQILSFNVVNGVAHQSSPLRKSWGALKGSVENN
jgi:MATE family multidrug resistance protein